MKNKNYLLVLLVAILSAYSFSNLYSKYQFKSLTDDLSENGVSHRVNYDLSMSLDEDIVLSNYDNLATNEEFVLYSLGFQEDDKVLKYYNPSQDSSFTEIINDYQKQCTIDCIKVIEVSPNDFSLGLSSIQVYSSSKIDKSLFSKYSLDVIFADEYIDLDHVIEEESMIQKMLVEYYLYIIINILICITLLFILFINIITNIREINLHAIYGYKFKTLFWDFNKRYLKSYLLLYLSVFILLTLAIYRNLAIILSSMLYALLQLLLIYVLFIIIQVIFYKGIKRHYQHRHLRKSIVILSIIIAILTVLTVQFMSSSITNTSSYLNIDKAYEIEKDYYELDHDMSIDVQTHAKISNVLVDEYGAIYRTFTDYDYKMLQVEESFFKTNGIKDIDGNKIVPSLDAAYIVDSKVLGDSFEYGFMSYDLVYIQDTGLDYITLDYLTPTVQLSDVIIVVKSREEMLASNVSLYSESPETAQKIFTKVYQDHGLEYEPKFSVLGNVIIKDEYYEKSISTILSAIVALTTILIANVSYTYLIFEHNKERILLANIYGHGYFNRMRDMLKEFAIVALMTLTIMMVIGIYATLIYLAILVIQFIVLNIVTNNLVGKSLVSNLKEEM